MGVPNVGDGAVPFAGATSGGSAGDPTLHLPACGTDPGVPEQPTALYGLRGAQAEPEAGAWLTGPRPLPRVVPLAAVLALTDAPGSPFYVPPYPTAAAALDWELAELVDLQAHRDDAAAVAGHFAAPPPAAHAAQYPPDFVDTRRAPLSDFVQLHTPPFGAVFAIADHPQYLVRNVNQQHLRRHGLGPVVATGRELARIFEMETPGLLHRHALQYLLYKRPELSPPRQARVWMALEVTLYSALAAAWHYKWLAGAPFRYRQRPYEYDRGRHVSVVFDDVVGDGGRRSKCARRSPCPSPGTPRHPAYPSGHSTYSAAASAILKYFFRDADSGEHLDRLANNIGTARLWAGVHWRSDHAAGVRIGRAVAHLVQQQLEADCIAPLPPAGAPPTLPPTPAALTVAAQQRRAQAACDPAHDAVPPQRADPFRDCPLPFLDGHGV